MSPTREMPRRRAASDWLPSAAVIASRTRRRSSSATAASRAPTVSLAADKTSFDAPGTVTLTATAADNVAVKKVEFYDGATLVSTDETAPYTATKTFSGADNGTHNFTAKAYDTSDNVATSTPAVAVTVAIESGQPAVPKSACAHHALPAGRRP